MTTSPLPASARLALWFSAWVDGLCSLDETRDAVVDGDAAHDVVGLPGSSDREPLILALGRLRGLGARRAGLCLPVPGDPLGLAGPAGFNADVLEAGEGVVLEGVDLGLVPHRAGAGVVWTAHPALSHRQVPDPSEADGALRQTLVSTTEALVDLEVARWRPEVADELMAMRGHLDLGVPATTSPRAVRMAVLATRCRTIVSVALGDDGGSVTALDADRRRAALDPLDRAARRALVAACSPGVWPPSR